MAADDALRAAETALARYEPVGPFHGVPFTIKDAIDFSGVPTQWRSKIFAEKISMRRLFCDLAN
jgi:aspartyl-tRNA(Asn)/glutamyl-tRNA(Gln) amidotransferase subunit A